MVRMMVGTVLLLAACATGSGEVRVRPATWAQPVIGAALDNWHRVSPELYRCGQPSAGDMRALEAFGVVSVVNLRELHSDRDEVEGSGLRLFEVPLDTGGMDYRDLVRALAAVVAAPKPVAVHCWRGSDRTGAVCAAWRVAVDGWTPAAALDEMVGGGFGHSAWYGNLRELIGHLDAERLRVDLAAAVAALQ
ncbi:MAG: tyrosine-protein phosphatase [Planctomycetes bacterium]|nr:tyrosine-protein phosphatase [Planctomycetota bacterium]